MRVIRASKPLNLALVASRYPLTRKHLPQIHLSRQFGSVNLRPFMCYADALTGCRGAARKYNYC